MFMAKLSDITEQRYGRLVALRRDGMNHNHESYWLCQCDCGGTNRPLHGSLTQGMSRSCGCLTTEARLRLKKDITGVRSGWLVAVECTGIKDKGGSYEWLCRCDCGGTKITRGSKITTGIVVSCGCARLTRIVIRDPVIRSDRLERQTRRRGISVNAEGSFTETEVRALYEKQNGKCVYCPTMLGDTFDRDHITPLVRGGSNYIANIQLLCPSCNRKKHDKLHEEFANQIGFIDDLL